MREKGMISLLLAHIVGVTKIQVSLLEKKTKREGKEEKLKKEGKSSVRPCLQGCEDKICILVSFKLLFHHLW
jgi:hypothetical protein